MARTARFKSCTGIYHVMMRGVNSQNIFCDDIDRDKFLWFLKSAVSHQTNISGKEAGKFSIYAYALMGNHFHLLVNVESGELGELIKKIAAGYVRYFNQRHKREGHLFKERFKSEACETFDYFCVLMGYIHQNPLKHGFVKNLRDWQYTSLNEYLDPENAKVKLCDVDYVHGKMSTDDIKKWTVEMLPDNLKCVDIDKMNGKISDEAIIKYLSHKYGIESPSEFEDMKKDIKKPIIEDLLEYGGAIRQISRVTGVNPMTISRINSKDKK